MLSQGQNLIVSVMVARLLGRQLFGEFAIVNSTVGMLGVFAGLGLGLTATKYVAEFRERDRVAVGEILGLTGLTSLAAGGAAGLGLLVAAPLLATGIFHAAHLTIPLRLGAGLLFFSALMGAQLGALAGFEAFLRVAQVTVVAGVLGIPIVFAATSLFSVSGAVGGLTAISGMSCVLLFRAVQHECKMGGVEITYRAFRARRSILFAYSMPAVLSTMVVMPALWFGNTTLATQVNGYSQLAIFYAANQLRAAAVFFSNVINQAALPVLSNLYAIRDSSYTKTLMKYLLLSGASTLLVCGPIALFSGPLMAAYGPGFKNGPPVLFLLLLAALLSAPASIVGSGIASIGRMWDGFLLNVAWLCAFIIALKFFVGLGAIGLAAAYLVSYSVHLISVTTYMAFRFGLDRGDVVRRRK